MVNSRLLLGFVAFGVSFGISLVTGRDAGRAFITGLTTLPATYAAVAVTDRRLSARLEERLEILKHHVYALQERRREAYEEYMDMLAEKEQIALYLDSMQHQLGPQLEAHLGTPMGAPIGSTMALPAARRVVSWDLSAPISPHPSGYIPPHDLPTELQVPPERHPSREPGVVEATATQRKLEANLNELRADLLQLRAEVTDHRQMRDRLIQEVASLSDQKQQLTQEAIDLHSEVEELKRCQGDLEEFLSYTESKKQELELGTHPLQVALKELQTQITQLTEELQRLEIQVTERRSQKAELEKALPPVDPSPSEAAAVAASAKSAEKPATNSKTRSPAKDFPKNSPSEEPSKLAKQGPPAKTGAAPMTVRKPPEPTATKSTPAVKLPTLPKPEKATPQPSASKSEKPAPELPPEWTELMVQLPEPEFEVLKAIAEQSHPAPDIKRIAEANLTMPELLIDSINERALDTVGDLILESGAGTGSAAIAPEHLKLVKKLIKTYEYLTR